MYVYIFASSVWCVRVRTRCMYAARAITNSPRFTCGACVCVPRCTCTNCRTIRAQTLSLYLLSLRLFLLPPSLLRTPTLSLSLCFPPFLSRVSPSSATVSCTCTSRFPVCTRTRRTHRELQPLSVLFYSHPRRPIAWASLSR